MRTILVVIFCLSAHHLCYAQESSSSMLGVQFGPSKFIGDVGTGTRLKDKLALDQNSFFAGFNFTALFRKKWGLQIGVNYGELKASDKNIKFNSLNDQNYLLYLRNLEFRSNISEWQAQAIAFPLRFTANKKWQNLSIQPYVMGGLGIFSFNPIARYFDEINNSFYDVELKNYHTEGQGFNEFPDRKAYALTQVQIPLGLGICYDNGGKWLFSLEFSNRRLFTDYLDDVSKDYISPENFDNNLNPDDAAIAKYLSKKYESNLLIGSQRGNAKNKDAYSTLSLKVQFKIKQNGIKGQSIYKYDDIEICL